MGWCCCTLKIVSIKAFDFVLVFPYEKWLSVPFVNSKICRAVGKTDSGPFAFYKAAASM